MSERPPRPPRDRVLAAFGLPTTSALFIVGLTLVLWAPSFPVGVVGATLLGLAGLAGMIDVFIRIGLSEDRERAAAEDPPPPPEPPDDPPPDPPEPRAHPPDSPSARGSRRLGREEWKPRRRP